MTTTTMPPPPPRPPSDRVETSSTTTTMPPPPPKPSADEVETSSATTTMPPPPAKRSAEELETTSTTPTMPPPPPKPSAGELDCPSTTTTVARMGPPPLKNRNPTSESPSIDAQQQDQSNSTTQHSSSVPYKIPEWSGAPSDRFFLEVLKDGTIIDQFELCKKGAYMFGRVDLCDFVLEHPTISRFHAVIQFKRSGNAYLYDIGSTHGTFINKNQVQKRVYVDLHVGDVIRFGQSSRLYIFQGPSELMPPETDLKILKESKIRRQMLDKEESLQRARLEASLADGISWGMGEDAIEEVEDDVDEVTWQTYKGQLTEKQEKTRDKIVKRMEKIAHMKKEIDVIRAKDISQGGLTQGQQTQIARNEQRITQIMEELENLEETLNDSIRESMGAHAGKTSRGKKKGDAEDDEDFSSDDDEFYDRTKKPSSVRKEGENQSIETVDTLLDKRDTIMKEMEGKKEEFERENNKMTSETALETESGDALDAYMSGLSSQLVRDKTVQLEKELSTLQSELDRIFYLLKIADPTGEATKKRDSKVQEPKLNKSEMSASAVNKKVPAEPKISGGSGKPLNVSLQKETTPVTAVESKKKPEADKDINDTSEGKTVAYTVVKPQWLGAIEERETKEAQQDEETSKFEEPDQFIGYKDRQKMLSIDDSSLKVDSGIESAASGLILRKKNLVEKSEGINNKALDQSTSSSVETELKAEDAVALLLKHKRAYHAADDEVKYESEEILGENQPTKSKKKPKRVLGPEKPSFLTGSSDYESWVPPEGQSGDGRTALNDRYGY